MSIATQQDALQDVLAYILELEDRLEHLGALHGGEYYGENDPARIAAEKALKSLGAFDSPVWQ